MKLTKALVAGTLVLGLCTSVSYAKTVKVTALIWGSGARIAILKNAAKDFMAKNPGIKVDIETVAGNSWADYYARVIARTAAGASPDIACVAIEGTQLFATGGWAVPLTPYIKADPEAQAFLKDVPQSVKDGLSYKGELLGMPRAVDTILTNYNTELLDKAGLLPPKADWTEDDFLEYVRKLTKDANGDGKKDIFGCSIEPSYFMNHGFLFAMNGSIMNQDWTASTANSDGTLAAAELFHKLSYEYGVNSAVSSSGASFQNGKTAMMFHGRYSYPGIPANFRPKWAVQVLPKFKTRATVVGLDGYMVLRGSKNKAAAFKVAKLLASNRVTMEEVVKFGQSLPATKTLLRSKEFTEMAPKNNIAYAESLEMAKPVPSPPCYGEFETNFMKYMGLVFANKMAPREAMNQLHQELTKVLAKWAKKRK